jgi:hypothetical protein
VCRTTQAAGAQDGGNPNWFAFCRRLYRFI